MNLRALPLPGTAGFAKWMPCSGNHRCIFSRKGLSCLMMHSHIMQVAAGSKKSVACRQYATRYVLLLVDSRSHPLVCSVGDLWRQMQHAESLTHAAVAADVQRTRTLAHGLMCQAQRTAIECFQHAAHHAHLRPSSLPVGICAALCATAMRTAVPGLLSDIVQHVLLTEKGKAGWRPQVPCAKLVRLVWPYLDSQAQAHVTDALKSCPLSGMNWQNARKLAAVIPALCACSVAATLYPAVSALVSWRFEPVALTMIRRLFLQMPKRYLCCERLQLCKQPLMWLH